MEDRNYSITEQLNMQIIQHFTASSERYINREITASEFAGLLTQALTPDVVFWSNYTPAWAALRPIFKERHGINAIIERYDYEGMHELIKQGTGIPFDFSISGDVAYYSQRETASFFGQAEVTWDMVTKVTFKQGQIARIETYLDSAPIERIYGAFAD